MGSTETWTIGRILRWTGDFFGNHGIDSPRLTAEILLAHALSLSRLDLYLRFDQPLTEKERSLFKAMVQRRIRREPLAHITGEIGFWNLDLFAGPEALIPRQDSETLVEAVLGIIPPEKKALALDLGTGTGCLALALASERPEIRFVACDLSLSALELARKNMVKNKLEDRVFLVNSDWTSGFAENAIFDFVVSNPPYIPSAHIGALAPEVRDFDPPLALDGGPDGLAIYRKLSFEVGKVLKPKGLLFLEIGYDQKKEVCVIFEKTDSFTFLSSFSDLGGHDRVLLFQSKSA